MAKHNNSRKKKKRGSLLLFIVEIVILAVLVVGVFVYAKLNEGIRNIGTSTPTADSDPNANTDDVVINSIVTQDERLQGYTNIALVGIDTRDSKDIDYANSDTMIIASINNDTMGVRMVSLYRDTYLNIDPENWKFEKANAAYCNGSAKQLLSMLNANLDLNITDYVVVDFSAVAKLVDDLGGISVYMTKEEVVHLNNYCVETAKVTGGTYTKLVPSEEPATYDLNGVQAVSYARIRYTAGNDPKRTQRQRLVIEKIVEKAKTQGISAIQSVITDVFPMCKTSFSSAQIIKMASQMFNYNIEYTSGFPFEHIEDNIGDLDAVIPVTLSDNVVELHKFLFDDDNYQVSDKVAEYSKEISDVSGYTEKSRDSAIANSVIKDSGGEADVVK
ncbi:MAG TPA: LCP family protein [Lachnospiraceae bacterium]|nr:LCP family protein [Lachnospiraceae bacterium]